MKYILLLMLHLVVLVGIAQKKPPSKPAAKSQTDYMKELEKELKELEEEDPEMAEKVREMIKQKSQKPAPKAALRTPPKYVSPITIIPYKLPISPPSPAQAKDRLLWYRGKKVNDSMLVNTSGDLILYRARKGEVVVRPNPKADPFKKMVDELAKTEQRKEELINYIEPRKNSFIYYPAVSGALNLYDRTSRRFHDAIKNTIVFPPESSKGVEQNTNSGSVKNPSEGVPELTRKLHREVLELMKNYPSIHFADPPSFKHSICNECDSSLIKEFDKKYDLWLEEFQKYEKLVANTAFRVHRSLKFDFYREIPEAVRIQEDMDKAIEFAMNRLRNKIDFLIRNHGNNFEKLPVIVEVAVAVERQKQLLGIIDSTSQIIRKVSELLNHSESFVEAQMVQRNYNIALDLRFLFGIERQKQMLELPSDPAGILARFEAFNRFRLSTDMDVLASSETLIANAGAKTTTDVYAYLAPIKCRFELILSSADFREGEEYSFRYPLIAKGGVKKQKEEDDRWVSYNYSGPAEMLGLWPIFSISFCENAPPDSVYLMPPFYKYEEMTEASARSVSKAYSIDHMGYLNMLFLKGTEESAEEGKQVAIETLAVMGQSHESHHANARLAKLHSAYEKFLRSKEMKDKMAQAISRGSLLVLFDAQNKQETIVNSQVDLAHEFQDEWSVKGKVALNVVHDPLPYKSTAKN